MFMTKQMLTNQNNDKLSPAIMMKSYNSCCAALSFVSLCFTVVIIMIIAPTTITAFHLNTPSSNYHRSMSSCRKSTTVTLFSAFQQMPGESKDAYFKRVTAVASDPKAFERMALETATEHESSSTTSLRMSNSDSMTTESSNNDDDDNGEQQLSKHKKTGYVRAEEWEKQWQERRKKGELSWEERVQFEGQRDGNRLNQNDILRHHLNAF